MTVLINEINNTYVFFPCRYFLIHWLNAVWPNFDLKHCHACPCANHWFRGVVVNCFLEQKRSTHYYSLVIIISQSMEELHCYLCYCSLWHHNAARIASVTSKWGTQWGALVTQKQLCCCYQVLPIRMIRIGWNWNLYWTKLLYLPIKNDT